MQATPSIDHAGRTVLGRAILGSLVMAGMVLSGGANARAETTPGPANYAEFWREHVKPAEGDFFLHPTYRPKVGISSELREKVRGILQSQLRDSVRKGKVTLDPGKKVTMSVDATHGYTRAQMTDEILQEFTDRAVDGFKEFLDYVDRPDLLPGLGFRLFDRFSKLEAPTMESAVMFLAWNRQIDMRARVHYQGQKAAIQSSKMRVPDSVRGQLVGVLTGSFDAEQGVNLRTVPHHAYGGVGYSAISSYAIPMSELFPLCLRPVTAERVNREINAAWTRQGKPVPFNRKAHQAIVTKWDVREDSLVESLIDEFIGSRLDELGFTVEEWTNYCRHGGSDQYALSPVIKEKIKTLGAPEVLRMYFEDPDELF